MAKRDMIGSVDVKLKNEPRNILPDNHDRFNVQMIGDKVKLQETPSTVKYGASTPNGELQMIGDAHKLSDKPFSGWQSYDTPVSDRTAEQKKGY